MRVAVLVKHVPLAGAEVHLGPDGRQRRDGVPMEINPHCRRAVAKGVELARATGGSCTVLTLGPPAAQEALVEALAWGADAAVHICDPAFAGSDTLATARALAAALCLGEPYDLVLVGRNSVDADTGQVGPQVAELAGLPFLTAVRSLDVDGDRILARCELDDGWRESTVRLPALLACAERLCAPAKVPQVSDPDSHRGRIHRLTAAHLGPGPWGQAGSPTRVTQVRQAAAARSCAMLTGTLESQAARVVSLLSTPRSPAAAGMVPRPAGAGPHRAVVVQPGRPRLARELLGGAAGLAASGTVTAVLTAGDPVLEQVGAWGADDAVLVTGGVVEEEIAAAIATWCAWRAPRVLLLPGTSWGREVAARAAARLGAGLTGDAVSLDLDGDRLICAKPVGGGQLLASVRAESAVQMATVRPGVLPIPTPRAGGPVPRTTVVAPAARRVVHVGRGLDENVDELTAARIVVGAGRGVAVEDYPLLEAFVAAIGGQLAATRAVTDAGWQPHSRQVGVTGRSISPDVYLAVGLAGKNTHMAGVRRAGTVVAVNTNPDAPVFASADYGVVAEWKALARAVMDRLAVGALA